VWLTVYRERAISRGELIERMHGSLELERAVDTLLRDGRVVEEQREGGTQLIARELMIPVGAEQGWESAVLDHFKAVASAIGAKVRKAEPRAELADTTHARCGRELPALGLGREGRRR
jgi:hypothetical protein